jgi:hypothetical protein
VNVDEHGQGGRRRRCRPPQGLGRGPYVKVKTVFAAPSAANAFQLLTCLVGPRNKRRRRTWAARTHPCTAWRRKRRPTAAAAVVAQSEGWRRAGQRRVCSSTLPQFLIWGVRGGHMAEQMALNLKCCCKGCAAKRLRQGRTVWQSQGRAVKGVRFGRWQSSSTR